MQNYFSEKSLFLDITKDVSEICERFFKRFGITFINHTRFFRDGSCYILTNHRDWLNYHFNKQYRLIETTPEQILINKKARIIPPSSYVIEDVERHFDVQCPFILFDFKEDFFDFFCFASTQKRSVTTSINCCINYIETFEKFTDHFKEKASPLISAANKQRLFLSEPMFANVKETFNIYNETTVKKKTLIDFNYNKVIFTQREYEVVMQMAMGKTVKEAARFLNITPKTIEFHLINAKNKTNCYYTKQLLRYFNDELTANIY